MSEVLRLRLSDIDREAPLHLVNMKQSKCIRGGALPREVVVVSADLVAQLRALARDARIFAGGYFFRSQKSQERPMSYGHCWRLLRRYSIAAGDQLIGSDCYLRPADGRDFRRGAAVNQVRQGVPLSEVQQQLGHARIDATTIYTKLAARDRLAIHASVEW